MESDYIIPRLLTLATMFYGKDSEPFAKEKQGVYIFGAKEYRKPTAKGKKVAKKKPIKNTITKSLAIYLVTNKLPKKKKK